MPATSNTRHAISRQTGTTTFVRPVKGVWTADCLSHKATGTAPSRTAAWKMGSTPSLFCDACLTISKGKADKIKGDLIPVPAAMLKTADAPGAKVARPAPKKAAPAPKTPATKKASAKDKANGRATPSTPKAPAKKRETAKQRADRIARNGFAKDSAESAAQKKANETTAA